METTASYEVIQLLKHMTWAVALVAVIAIICWTCLKDSGKL